MLVQPSTLRVGITRLDLAGDLRASDLRESLPDTLVIHRNTVPDILRSQPGFVDLGSGGGIDLELTARWYADPTNRYRSRLFPYHFFICRYGQVFQVHDPMVVSPHARGRNKTSIGIAIGVDGRREAPSEHVYEAANNLVKRYRAIVPDAVVVGHSARKQCPGRLIDVARIHQGEDLCTTHQ